MRNSKIWLAVLLGCALLANAGSATWPTKAAAGELLTDIDTLKRAVEAFKLLMEMYGQYSEVTGKLDKTNLTPEKIQEFLDGVAKRAESHQARELLKAAKLDANQAFSPTKSTRDAVRKSWEEYLSEDEDEIRRLKERRDYQQEWLERYRSVLELQRKAGKVLDKLSSDPVATGVLQEEAEWAWYQVVVEAQFRMEGIVTDETRIVRDYDKVIRRREAEHNANEAVLRTLRAIQGVDQATATGGSPSAAAQPAPRGQGQSAIQSRIKQAVEGGGGATLDAARRSRGDIEGMRRDRARAEAQAQQAQSPNSRSGGDTPPSAQQGSNGQGGYGGGAGADSQCGAPNCLSYEYKREK